MTKRKNIETGHLMFSMVLVFGLCVGSSFAAQSPQVPLAGSAIPQFVQPLPILTVSPFADPPLPNTPYLKAMATTFGNQPLTIRMCEFDAKVLPPGTFVPGVQPLTRVWGYIVDTGNGCPAAPQETYIGPVIVNERELFDTCNVNTLTCTNHSAKTCAADADCNMPTSITFVNDLGSTATTGVLAYKYSTDKTLHWADPEGHMCMMDKCNMGTGTCTYSATPTGCTSDAQCTSMIPAFGSICSQNYSGPIPAVAHLHGGEVPPDIDGGPDAWFTSDGLKKGHAYHSFAGAPANGAVYKYPNTQEASPIWFHDHTLGATRLNVYAGLAGAYFIYDPTLALPANLHSLPEVVPMVLQDRMFDTNGQLFFPSDTAGNILWTPNPDHPYWVPEFVGDTIVVNGKAWPFLDVEAKRYRFLFLNGSNARAYEMFLLNQATGAAGPGMWVIGTDGGYLDTPVAVNKLVMQPGERYEVIIDFAGFTGSNLIVRNTGRTPYPKGAPPQGSTLGRIMQFRVGAAPLIPDASYNPALLTPLRVGTQMIKRLVNPVTGTLATTAQKTRALTLNEVMGMGMTANNPVTGLLTNYPGGPLEILVNNTKYAGANRPDFQAITVGGNTTYYSELPQEGDTEIWEIINLTADAHPMHLHLVQFQLMNRQNFNVNKYTGVYNAAFGADTTLPALPAGCLLGVFCPAYGPPLNYNPSTASGGKYGGNPDVMPWLQGKINPPAPNEAGWKDTVIAYPGQVTRIAVRWAPTDLTITAAPDATLYYPFDPSDGTGHGYVWHCHIVDHEDNEMMRPDVVDLNPLCKLSTCAPANRPLLIGIDY
jgi:spore coat protein A